MSSPNNLFNRVGHLHDGSRRDGGDTKSECDKGKCKRRLNHGELVEVAEAQLRKSWKGVVKNRKNQMAKGMRADLYATCTRMETPVRGITCFIARRMSWLLSRLIRAF